ncbi:monocarboxylate transporter 13-like [Branchiostoma lanceolatum]|uniref:monocarboxylate transporter 13-like n=1 Tax=Branchiostoma lanceolatum TaxID=7740 RepID=UPI003455CCF9
MRRQSMLLEKVKGHLKDCAKNEGREYDRPPDGGWGWVVVLAALCNLGFMYGTVRSLGVFFVPMMETFDTNAGTTSWVVSTLMGCSFACGPVSGALIRKFGSRPVAMTGGVFVCIGYFLSSFATEIYHVYVTLGLVAGVGVSLTHVASTSIVSRYFDRRRGLANSLALMGTCIGSFALPPLFQLLIDEYGMRGSLIIIAGLELQACVFSSFFRPIQLKGDAKKLTRAEEENSSEAVHTDKTNRTLCCCNIIDKSLFRVPAYLVHIGTMMLFTFSFPTLIFFIVPRARSIGIEEYSAAFLLSANAITDVIGRLSSGLIMSFRPSPLKRLWLAVIAALCLGVTSLVFTLSKTYTLMLVMCVLFGLFSGLFVPTIVTVIPDFVEIAKFPQALGTMLLFNGVMQLIGSPVVGWLFDVTGSYNVSFLLCGGMVVTSALFRLTAHCIMGDMGFCRSTTDRTQPVIFIEAEQKKLLKTTHFPDEPVVIELETTV